MSSQIPSNTIEAFARSIVKEARAYGFEQVDLVRLVNELLEAASGGSDPSPLPVSARNPGDCRADVFELPLIGDNIQIRSFNREMDLPLLRKWLPERYGRFFVLSCATARADSVDSLVADASNVFGIINVDESTPIGALAYLDCNETQRRAELRKLIGEPEYRGRGLAEEATRLWISYGFNALGFDKIFVSTLQTHLKNIELNERIGFRVEGLLKNEVLIDGERKDVLRMGICRE